MAFWEGMLAGYGIAIPVGAIAILIIDTALRRGFYQGCMAGAGAASADLLFASLAALAGGALAPWIDPVSDPIRLVSGIVLVSLGIYGFWRLHANPPKKVDRSFRSNGGGRTYAQFLGLTLLNPLTIVYFASLILGGGSTHLVSTIDRAGFVVGAGLASLSWQTLLAGSGAIAHQRLSPRAQTALSIFGNLIVAGLGLRLIMSW
jgi:threonine/homoserine/homoserine lactone efflux protein